MTKLKHSNALKTLAIIFAFEICAAGAQASVYLLLFKPIGIISILSSPETNTNRFLLVDVTIVTFESDAIQIECPKDISTYTDINECTADISSSLNPEVLKGTLSKLTWIMEGATEATSSLSGINQIGNFIFNEGVTFVRYTGNDNAGNSVHCSFTVVVSDNQAPEISAPKNISIKCKDRIPSPHTTLQAFLNAGGSASDNCELNPVTFKLESEQKSNPTCPYAFIRTYQITDRQGNIGQAKQFILVEKSTEPILSEQEKSSQTLKSGMATTITSTAIGGNWNDGTSWLGSGFTLTFADVTTPGSCANTYTIIRTWTALDECDNSNSASQIINVRDVTAPVITCPPPASGPVDINKRFSTTLVLGTATATDNCGTPTITNNLLTLFPSGEIPVGIHTITWTATDACGNFSTCTQSVTVTDEPEIVCPDSETFIANGNCEYPFNPGVPTLTQGSQPLDWTWTLSNPGNPPSVPAVNISGGSSTTTEEPIPSPIVAAVPNEYVFQLGVTTITWTTTNAAGNTATCDQTIIVEDNEPPTFTSAPITNCVDLIYSATYTSGTPNIYNRDNLIIYSNPDGYTFIAGNTTLDITDLADNCCDPDDMIINWTIDFTQTPDPDGPAGTMQDNGSVSGTGQPSDHGSDMFFPGDGVTFQTVTHTITYEVTDCNGNGPVTREEDIVVTSRPEITKMN